MGQKVKLGIISLSYFWTTMEALRGQKLGAANGGPNASIWWFQFYRYAANVSI